MPNYTTSYSPKKPHMRRNTKDQGYLRPGRRAQRRPGAQYLNHSQGFGRKRKGFRAGGNNSRKPYAIIGGGLRRPLFCCERHLVHEPWCGHHPQWQ